MSLIVDPDHLIHSLRLAYLKRIDDHYGPRIITFPSVIRGQHDAATLAPGQTDMPASLSMSSSSSTSFFASSSTAALRDAGEGSDLASLSRQNLFGADSHVVIAGLTDPARHPEVATIYSPVPTVGEAAGPFGGFAHKNGRNAIAMRTGQMENADGQRPGGLSYTNTIYGPGRSGALGMRVDGRRASKRVSISAANSPAPPSAEKNTSKMDPEEITPPETGTEEAGSLAPDSPNRDEPLEVLPRPPSATLAASPERDFAPLSSTQNRIDVPGQGVVMGKRVNFAEPGERTELSNLPPSLDPEALSEGHSISPHPHVDISSRHDSVYAESSTESNAALSSLGSAGSLQDGSLGLNTINAAITGGLHSPHSLASHSIEPAHTVQSSPTRSRAVISPLVDTPALSMPPTMVISSTEDSDENSDASKPTRASGRPKRRDSRRMGHPSSSRVSAQPDYFSSIRVSRSQVESQHANRPKGSMLSSMLQKQDSGPENPFAPFYAGIAGRAATVPSMTVDIYFPWAESRQPPSSSPPASGAVSVHPKTKCMKLNIRKDATMEEVIGYGLYCYIEERWKPELDPPDSSLSDSEREVKLTTVGWTLMIVEDGEVDDDFPAIDQSLLLGKFGGDEFAICEATPNQIKQHREAYGNIARRTVRAPAGSKTPTRGVGGTGESVAAGSTMADPAQSMLAGGAKSGAAAISANPALASRLGVPGASGQVTPGSLVNVQGTPIFASGALSRGALGSSSQAIFLRVLVTPNPEVRYKTTLQVPSDMYLADVLEMICRKRHLSNVDEWALIVPDKSIVVPLDRTVESLQGNHDLALVRRSSLGALGGTGALSSSSTNPNASIFKRYSATSDPSAGLGQPKYTKALDIAAAYKSYTVYRKSPMFGGRHNERSLTLDGDWIHIMPTDMKTFGKAASFHVSSVVACKLSSKLANGFKLVVWRESPRDTKRYDFEAESGRIAAEIVREINLLRSSQNS